MIDVFIHDVVRTPRGKGRRDDALCSVKPVNLMAGLLRTVQRRNDLGTTQVDDIALGCVTPVGDQGTSIAKTAALVTDWGERVAGVQINRFCTSGLEAMNLRTMKVYFGSEDLTLVDGVESVSRVLMGSDGGARVLDPEISLHTSFVPQGVDADLIVTLENFSRVNVDAFVLHSRQKVAKVRIEGLFGKSLAPVTDQNDIVLPDHDEFIHADSTLEGLATLKPSFETTGQMGFDATALRKYSQVEHIEHVYTPGNSSGVANDASVMPIDSEAKGRELGLEAQTRTAATAVALIDSTVMFIDPVLAIRKILAKVGLRVEDTNLFEINEMFALVVIKFMKDMGVAENKVNANGGTIAMDHPLGATDYTILGTPPDEPERCNLRYGLVTLCAGGGMGIVTIIGRV